MYCHNCGKEIFDDAEFCQYCGCNLKKELLKELEAEVEDPPIAVKVLSAKEINQEESDKAINTDEQAKKLNYGYLNYKELSNRLTDIENISLEYLKLLNSIITNKEDLAQKVDDVIKEIQDHKKRELNLVVAGEFSRGKSTFINALLREALLPVNIRPTTAKVTILKYGDRKEVNVVFADGKRKHIDPKDLEKYVAEYGDSKNEVKEIEIKINSPFLKNGINLIDTPGVNVNLEEHLNITKRALSTSDIIIFLLTSSNAVTKSEIAFLKANCPDLRRVFFVLNMIDKVEEEEREETIDYAKDTLARALALNKEGMNFYPVSALKSLEGRMKGDGEEWGFDKLEVGLKDFSEFQKNSLALQKLLQFISTETNSFKNELDNIFNPEKQKLSKIDDEIKQLKDKLSNNILPNNMVILENTYSEIKIILEQKRSSIKKAVKNKIKKYLKEHFDELQEEDEKITRTIVVILEEELQNIANELRSHLNKTFKSIKNKLDKELGSLVTLIDGSTIKHSITFDNISNFIPVLFDNTSLDDVNNFEELLGWLGERISNFLNDIFETEEEWSQKIMVKFSQYIDNVIENGLLSIEKNLEKSYSKATANINKIKKQLNNIEEKIDAKAQEHKSVSIKLAQKYEYYRQHFESIKNIQEYLKQTTMLITNIEDITPRDLELQIKQIERIRRML